MAKNILLVIVCCSFLSCDYVALLMNSDSARTTDSFLQDTFAIETDSLATAFDSSLLSSKIDSFRIDTSSVEILSPTMSVDIKNVKAADLVAFAKKLKGTPYQYASTDPLVGFDCSGFITYVFNHFNIAVPRSSIDFTNVGKTISVENATMGDLILFTGTEFDSTYISRTVGHMGIVTENADSLRFIHSSSGKANGVTITPLNTHYQKRFVKVIRIFP